MRAYSLGYQVYCAVMVTLMMSATSGRLLNVSGAIRTVLSESTAPVSAPD